ncbi:MAG: N-succinylarginine dihydrolase [Oleiphilaceae bacterium]|nr:N-succinylarginine dihydrolase [Oleiphilaceae bacterium]
MRAVEANFDGLVGPTHNYAGLSYGNIASQSNLKEASNPKLAAKQGLMKMKALADRGFKQGIIAPQARPDLSVLRALGFSGSDSAVLNKAAKRAPELLANVYSASSMWTANAATVSPSADTADGRVHFSVANLNAKFHRSLEPPTTERMLKAMFGDERYFAHHAALPATAQFGDEGAANHNRFCRDYGEAGVELFVYGREGFNEQAVAPSRFPARQTREACEAIARRHGLSNEHFVLAQQTPEVIDAGVFHNDVIAVSNRNVLFAHEAAFVDGPRVLAELQEKLGDTKLICVTVHHDQVSVSDAVRSYLFNSQLLSLDDERMLLVVPQECREIASVSDYLDSLVQAGGPISEIQVFDLKQSMRNGGGPACLRLRVVLTEQEVVAVNPNVWMNDTQFERLNAWVDKHYRDRLTQADLADPSLLEESRRALDELSAILSLNNVYPFQS